MHTRTHKHSGNIMPPALYVGGDIQISHPAAIMTMTTTTYRLNSENHMKLTSWWIDGKWYSQQWKD